MTVEDWKKDLAGSPLAQEVASFLYDLNPRILEDNTFSEYIWALYNGEGDFHYSSEFERYLNSMQRNTGLKKLPALLSSMSEAGFRNDDPVYTILRDLEC